MFTSRFMIILLACIAWGNSVLAMQNPPSLENIWLMKKAELHLHLGGSWPLRYLESIAQPEDFEELKQFLHKIHQGIDYHAIFEVFRLCEKIVNTNQKVEDGVAALCEGLAFDNVTYAEIRTGLKDLGSGPEEYLKAVLRGIQKGCKNSDLKAVVLLSLRRNSNREMAEKTISLLKEYQHQGVVGLDISGDSTIGNGNQILDILASAREQGFPLSLHLGESPKETAEQQMKELRMLNPTRIGHAVHLCDEAIEWVKERRAAVEFCPSSALMTGMVKKLRMHSAINLLLEGHPVAICTDDPLIFGVSLSEEFAKVAQVYHCTIEDLIRTQEELKEFYFG